MLISFAFYSFTLITMDIDSSVTGTNDCVCQSRWLDYYKIFQLVDTIQTMIIPFIIISISNVLIVYKLTKKFDANSAAVAENNHLRKRSLILNIITDIYATMNNNMNGDSRFSQTLSNIERHNYKSHKETVKTLFIISTTFLILNFPLCSIKLHQIFNFNSQNILPLGSNVTQPITVNYNLNLETNSSSTDCPNSNLTYSYNNFTDLNCTIENELTDFVEKNQTVLNILSGKMKKIQIVEIITKLAHFVYYINFSINFFLYTTNQKQFRNVILTVFRKPNI